MLKEQRKILLKKVVFLIRNVAEKTKDNNFSDCGFYKPKKPEVRKDKT